MPENRGINTKDALLGALKQHKESWISGQLLSHRLSMTRTAVWKQVRALKALGYEIQASPRKGYRLRGIPDLLLAPEIMDGLKTRIFGRAGTTYFRQIDSTNLRAKEMAAQGAPHGTLIVAEHQTQGRGRRQRTWFSPLQQGIYASLILRPTIVPMQAPRMTLLAAVAVADTLNALTPLPARIKWPNDILVQGRKIAGVLTEISTSMDTVDYMVVGLGLNVNIPPADFPDEVRKQATSILAETGASFSRLRLLRGYLEHFEYHYDIFMNIGFDPVMQRWKSLTEMLGRRVSVEIIGRQYVGEVRDLDQDGFLILQDDDGQTCRIFSGDVTLL